MQSLQKWTCEIMVHSKIIPTSATAKRLLSARHWHIVIMSQDKTCHAFHAGFTFIELNSAGMLSLLGPF